VAKGIGRNYSLIIFPPKGRLPGGASMDYYSWQKAVPPILALLPKRLLNRIFLQWGGLPI